MTRNLTSRRRTYLSLHQRIIIRSVYFCNRLTIISIVLSLVRRCRHHGGCVLASIPLTPAYRLTDPPRPRFNPYFPKLTKSLHHAYCNHCNPALGRHTNTKEVLRDTAVERRTIDCHVQAFPDGWTLLLGTGKFPSAINLSKHTRLFCSCSLLLTRFVVPSIASVCRPKTKRTPSKRLFTLPISAKPGLS